MFCSSYDSVSSSSYMNYDYLVIRTYQIVPTNLTNMESSNNPDLHKLLNVAYMPSFRQGWQVNRNFSRKLCFFKIPFIIDF